MKVAQKMALGTAAAVLALTKGWAAPVATHATYELSEDGVPYLAGSAKSALLAARDNALYGLAPVYGEGTIRGDYGKDVGDGNANVDWNLHADGGQGGGAKWGNGNNQGRGGNGGSGIVIIRYKLRPTGLSVSIR